MITKLIKTLLACSFLGTASIALAVPVTFDFTGTPNGNGDPLSYSVGGIDLEVSGTPGIAVDRNQGLGVRSSRFDSNQIDGFGPDETLHMIFSETVKLESITFGSVNFNDDFTLSIDNSGFVFDGDIPGGSFFGAISNLNTSSENFIGTNFDFSVTERNDDYYIRKIKVTQASVPESGTTLTLAGFGLLSLALARRLV